MHTHCLEASNSNRERVGNPISQQQTLHLRVHDYGCAALNTFQLCGVSRYPWCDVSRLYGVPDSCTAAAHIPCSCSFLNSFSSDRSIPCQPTYENSSGKHKLSFEKSSRSKRAFASLDLVSQRAQHLIYSLIGCRFQILARRAG